jgi:hypothetical protein
VLWTHAPTCLQVRDAIAAAEADKVPRTGAALRAMRVPRAGLVQQHIREDYQAIFEQPLDYAALGHSRLTDMLRDECGDIVAPAKEFDQFCTEVSVRAASPGCCLHVELVEQCLIWTASAPGSSVLYSSARATGVTFVCCNVAR